MKKNLTGRRTKIRLPVSAFIGFSATQRGIAMKGKKLVSVIICMLLLVSPVSAFGFDDAGYIDTGNETEAIQTEEPADGSEEQAGEEQAGEEPAEVRDDEDQVPEAGPEGLDESGTEEITGDKLNANAPEESPEVSWTAEDFTYEYKSKLMYGCDYTRQLYVNGQVIAGFSEQGQAKLDAGNTDLVIPPKTPEGEMITGIGSHAFDGAGLTSVRFPTGMLVPYDDKVTHDVTRRGNFIIHESAFANNELTEVYLPAGVLGCMANAFQKNRITKVTLPRTIWWIETLAFANNEISRVSFPQTCDFRLEMHGMTFADNNITSVRIPDYTEVINKDVFAMNPGMEPMTEEIARKRSETDWEKYMPGGSAESGIVYMYTDREALFDAQRIHTIDRPTKNQWSPFQKLVLISSETPDADTEKWSTADFTYDGTTITGLSESGIEKRSSYTKLDIPDRTPTGEFVREIASTDKSYGGVFGEEIRDDNGELVGVEGFDVVTLPNGLRKIGDRAFARIGLKEVVFPNQLQEIGLAAFQSNELEDVILPDSVTEIGGGAFASNPNLKSISIPHNENYTVIAGGTFGCSDGRHWMTNLTSIEIPDTITEIGDNAFAGNNFERIEIPASVKRIGRLAFSTKNYLQTPTTLILNEGLETIGSWAFRNKKIESVVLPTTVTGLPENTFMKVDTDWGGSGHGINNPLITRVFVTTEEQYNDKDNFPDSDWQKIYLSDPNRWTAEDFEFGETEIAGAGSVNAVTGLSEHGLAKAEINTHVIIPEKNGNGDDVAAVAPEAFADCGLTGVTITADTIEHIGEEAFSGNDITDLELGEGVKTIGKDAFKENSLVRVTLPASLESVGEGAFSYNDIDSLVFTEGGSADLAIAANAFAGNKLKSLQVCDNLDALSGTAFSGNPGMDNEPGVVRIYKATGTGSALEYKSAGNSSCQDIVFGEIPPELAPWGTRHFVIEGDTITGFSADGEEKLRADHYVVLPGRSEDGTEITTVGERAFYDYSGKQGVEDDAEKPLLKGVEFAPSITTLKLGAFQMCAIEDLVLPDTIKVMEPSVFSSNYGMRSITLSEGLTEIPDGVFITNVSNGQVKDVVIPEGVTRIGKNAFRGQHVENLTLPDTLESIDESAFFGHQIEELEIPASVKTIGYRAFEVRQDGIEALPSKLILHEGLEEIGSQAFGQTSLDSVEIPQSLKILPADAFVDWLGNGRKDGEPVYIRTSNADQAAGTGEYTGIAVNGTGHKVIYDKMVGTGWSYDDFTYSNDGKVITGWTDEGDRKRKEYAAKPEYPVMVMPDKPAYDSETYITEIGENAFQLPLYNETTGEGEVTMQKFDCDSPYGIQRMVFPEKLEKIGACAFEYNNLKAVNLESAQMLTSIGTSAFHGNHLVRVTIPDTVTELGGGAFAMNNIFFLTLSQNVTKIPQGCFSMNIFMSEVEIPDTVTEIGEEAFAGARLETLDIPASVTRIGKKAFHLHHLKSLHIPGNVKYIDDSAFEGTYKDSTLTKLIIDEGVEYIGKYAFKEALLEEVDLPNSLEDMGVDPFYSNKGKDGSGVVILYSKNRNHLDFNNDEYHGKEDGVSKHYHQVIYTGSDPVTITLDVNGGQPLDIESIKSDDSGTITGTLPVPEPGELSGVVFLGWYTEKDGGEEVKAGSSFSRDVTIYAHWTDAPFVVDEAKETAESDAAKASESVDKIADAATRDEKEKAAEEAKADAEKAVESAERAEKIAEEALRAAEIEDEAGSTEETRAKVVAAGRVLSAVRSAKTAAYTALAAASEVIEQITEEKANEAAEAERQAAADAAAAAEAARQGTPDGSLPKVKIAKPKAAKKTITVKWKKLSKKQLKTGTQKIEVWVCPNNGFGSADTVIKTTGKKKASLKVKGLAKGTYYVKVRAIKNSGGTKLVGPWSKAKKVKVKK